MPTGNKNLLQGIMHLDADTEASKASQARLEAKDEEMRLKILRPTREETRWRQLSIKLAGSEGKVRDRLTSRFDRMSSYDTPAMIDAAVKLILGDKTHPQGYKLINPKQYAKLLNYFTQQGSGGSEKAIDILNKCIEEFKKDTVHGQDYINRSLMIAARCGDLALFNKLMDEYGAEIIDKNKKLVADEYGKSILHYACDGGNVDLIKQVADFLRIAKEEKKFTPPTDSYTDGQFDPFRLRDDQLAGQFHVSNYIRPIHLLTPEVATKLDAAYHMPTDGRPGTFLSASNHYKLDNKVLNRGLFGWFLAKLSTRPESLEMGLLGGKALAGIPVANIADHAPDAIMNLGESAFFVGLVAAGLSMGIACRNVDAQRAAKRHCGTSKEMHLPKMELNKATQKWEMKEFEYPAQYQRTRGSNTHNMEEALKARDIAELKRRIQDQYDPFKTTHQMINLVRLQRDLNFGEKPENGFKKSLFESLIKNIKFNFPDRHGKEKLEKILDIPYRRGDRQLVIDLIQYCKTNPTISRTIGLNELNEMQHKLLRDPPVDYDKAGKLRNHELKKAFEKYDYHKIEHIITSGNFDRTSMKVFHALQEMSIFPLGDLSGSEKPKIEELFTYKVYAGLMKKADPDMFNKLLDDLTLKIKQPLMAAYLMKKLIDEYSQKALENPNPNNEYIEKLKVLALYAARLNLIPTTKNPIDYVKLALDPIQKRGINLMDVTDKQGNNLLHYAAKAQHSDMVKYLLKNTSIIEDFNLTARQRKKEEGIAIHVDIDKYHIKKKYDKVLSYIGSGKLARHVLQMPNRYGETPAKLLHSKDANAVLDRFAGNTTGFRLEGNQWLFNKDLKDAQRVNTLATLSVVLAAVGACSAWGVPGAIMGGKALGSLLAAHTTGVVISSNFTIGGGLSEGLFAVTAAKTTELAVMPLISRLYQGIARHLSAAFNGNSARTTHDYTDRIFSISNLFLVDLMSQYTKLKDTLDSKEAIGDFIKGAVKEFIDKETNDTKKALAAHACISVANEIADRFVLLYEAKMEHKEQIKAEKEQRNALDIKDDKGEKKEEEKDEKSFDLGADFAKHREEEEISDLLKESISDIAKSYAASSNNNDADLKMTKLTSMKDAMKKELENIPENKLDKKEKHLSYFIETLEKFKEKYVGFESLSGEEFISTAKTKIENDFKMRRDLYPGDAKKEQALVAEKGKLIAYIQTLSQTYDAAIQERQILYARRFAHANEKEKTESIKLIEKELMKLLHNIEGGFRNGPLLEAFKEWQKGKKDPAALTVTLQEAYKKIKHPEPEKGFDMMHAINAYQQKIHGLNAMDAEPSKQLNINLRGIMSLPPSLPASPINLDSKGNLIEINKPKKEYSSRFLFNPPRSTKAAELDLTKLEPSWCDKFVTTLKAIGDFKYKLDPQKIEFKSDTKSFEVTKQSVSTHVDVDDDKHHDTIIEAMLDLYLKAIDGKKIINHVITLSEPNPEIQSKVEMALASRIRHTAKRTRIESTEHIGGQTINEILKIPPISIPTSPSSNEENKKEDSHSSPSLLFRHPSDDDA